MNKKNYSSLQFFLKNNNFLKQKGSHRALGPSITRVRSTNLDKWTSEFVEIMDNVGNRKANEF